jgi:poly(3-hydroxybutyrate) depolymerase
MFEQTPLRIHLLAAFVLALTAAGGSASTLTRKPIESGGRHRVCYVYAPQRLAAETPAPVLLLFHGSGRDGLSLINEWKKLADSEGILLAAPDALDRRQWVIPDDGPELLGDIMRFLRTRYAIDGRRIYAFGHSAGAGFALRMAPLESTLLAAVAVHAGAFAGAADSGILSFAERKIPVFIVVGTKDQYFPLDIVRQTREAFSKAGFPAELRELPGHDHNYYIRSTEINAMVWAFLSAKHLDENGHYSAYRFATSSGGVSMTPIDTP